uniref:Uncharacterized protein n=1 Tax=Panagrellus redivivus TaxID=6233 RepID=A0A7E4VTW6_PANRE
MIACFRTSWIVFSCAIVAVLLPYSIGIICCLDKSCEETEICKPENPICVAIGGNHSCGIINKGELSDFPNNCDEFDNCLCKQHFCNSELELGAANPMTLGVDFLFAAAVIAGMMLL